MIRIILISIAAVGVAALSLSSAIGVVAETKNPPLAMQMLPENGLALAEAASLSLQIAAVQNDGAMPEVVPADVEPLALRSYRLEPADPESLRLIALVAESKGDITAARKLMQIVPRMSLRDKPANLWLVQDYGRQNMVDEALTAYDRTLRASTSSLEQLMPVMVSSMADQRLIAPYAELLERRPPWAAQFWNNLIRSDPALVNTGKMRQLTASKNIASSEEQDRELIRRLADKGHLQEALDLYRALDPAGAGRPLLANGDFSSPPGYAPFDWELTSTGYFGASIAPGSEQMFVSAVPGSSGVAARQLVRLGPGNYRLTAKLAGAAPKDANVGIVMRCAESGSQVSRRFRIEGTSLSQQVSADGSCTFHWLEAAITIPSDGTAADLVFESIGLVRL